MGATIELATERKRRIKWRCITHDVEWMGRHEVERCWAWTIDYRDCDIGNAMFKIPPWRFF